MWDKQRFNKWETKSSKQKQKIDKSDYIKVCFIKYSIKSVKRQAIEKEKIFQSLSDSMCRIYEEFIQSNKEKTTGLPWWRSG